MKLSFERRMHRQSLYAIMAWSFLCVGSCGGCGTVSLGSSIAMTPSGSDATTFGLTGLLLGCFFILMSCVPVVLVTLAKWRAKRTAKHAVEEFLARVGPVDYSGYEHGSGIAISRANRQIHLFEDNLGRTYPFEQVRGWRTERERPGQVITNTGNVQVNARALGMNLRMRVEAMVNTGLFVSVQDVDHPVWHVRMQDKALLARWSEILRQGLGG
jgi:hypothetical protein